MFLIRNISPYDVVLDDLRIILGPNKEIDLDLIAPRHQTENSHKLRLTMQNNNRKIIVVSKDTDNVHLIPHNDKTEMFAMEKRLKTELSAQIEKKNDQISQLTEALNALVKQLSTQSNQPVQVIHQHSSSNTDNLNNVNSYSTKEEDDISIRLHAKAMARMSKDVIGNIEHDQKSEKDNDMQNNIRELENLGNI